MKWTKIAMLIPAFTDSACFLPTGFPHLDHLLRGGYPCGAITVLSGHPHASRAVAGQARRSAGQEGLRVGYLRTGEMGNGNDPLFAMRLWSLASLLLFQSVEVLIVEGVAPAHYRAMPKTLGGLVERRQRTMIVTVARARRAAVHLNFTPAGWLYRDRRIYAYRARVALYSPAIFPSPVRTTLSIPVQANCSVL